jgi:flagellar hook-associated protein 3 FlgL
MRISTQTIFEQGIFNLQRNQSALTRGQEQISTGRRILSPSDDPVASARALEVGQARFANDQLIRNADSAESAIALQEEALGRYTRLLQDVKASVVASGNGVLTGRERKDIAAELRGRYDELIGLANTTDSNGLFLFSGFQGSTQPFTENAPGVVAYNGDQGQRLIQVGPVRDLPVSFAGSDIFQRIRDGNGTFVTEAAAANTGTGIVTKGVVTDLAAWENVANSRAYEIRFHVDSSATNPVTTYDIVDTVNGVSMLTGNPPVAGPHTRTYQSGAAIDIATQAPPDTNPVPFDYGVEFSVTGAPADGDVFTVNQSTAKDVFSSLHDLIVALENSGSGATANTRLTNALNTAHNSLDNALDVSLTITAAVGAYSKEVDTNRNAAEDLNLQFEKTIAGLEGLDYNEAITRLTFSQVSLQAAQKSFMQIQALTLFEYL